MFKMTKIAGLGLMALVSVNANALVIDNFDGTGPFTFNAPQVSVAAGVSSAGYARTVTATTDGVDTNVQIDTGTNAGVFAHSQSSGVKGTSSVNYTLGGVDLTEGSTQNAIRVTLVGIDLNGLFGLVVNGVSQSLNSTAVILANGGVLPSYADFLFSSFAGVDFTNVTTFSLFIDGSGTDALDASLDNVGTVCSSLTANGGAGANPNGNLGNCAPPTVPEPATLALLGAGLAGFRLSRRKAA